MKTRLISFVSIITLAWGYDVFYLHPPVQGDLPWLIQRQGLYLSGLWAIALMSLVMVLSIRPAWLEKPLGGMDKMYRLHKWAGILGISAAGLHWLLDMSSDLIKSWIGKTGRPPKGDLTEFAAMFRSFAKDSGELIVYALLIMLVLTLWKKFPYKFWRYIHKVMPVFYLLLVFHTIVLAPANYWMQPLGILLVILFIPACIASVISLAGMVGKPRQSTGTITSIQAHNTGITEVTCKMDTSWKEHHAGQFAFLTFDHHEGAHPFTISSAPGSDKHISFQIKALGDYTRQLSGKITVGQKIKAEGPYGCFDLSQLDTGSHQTMIAGGIGITPFLSWLEDCQKSPGNIPSTDLHYCVRNADNDPFIKRILQLCETLPSVRLHVHQSEKGERLSAQKLAQTLGKKSSTSIWYCGPTSLANSIKTKLKKWWHGKFTFHQEAFEMR
ncbi:ferric reductase-like transmembrane domain-containing protein [Advenella sp. WQ 585]|uniref:Ferric reductase-like transmembrane domain-containing protein n=1 Tax=Advenella mandrilli TaxID=2800330 RepID=A0ABS1EF01_9BURK|nr:ferric reductase-like transmembrane domain-containing protein [Advenella mandrilli]MBK1780522.1 ferric reductase-like transmembrane domain-containing protein [Advenella mandrilli]